MELAEVKSHAARRLRVLEEQTWGMSDEDQQDWYVNASLLVQVEQAQALKRIAAVVEAYTGVFQPEEPEPDVPAAERAVGPEGDPFLPDHPLDEGWVQPDDA